MYVWVSKPGGKGLNTKMNEIKADSFLSEAMGRQLVLGNKLKAASTTTKSTFWEVFLHKSESKSDAK